jgi:hypothetical protein
MKREVVFMNIPDWLTACATLKVWRVACLGAEARWSQSVGVTVERARRVLLEIDGSDNNAIVNIW